MAREITRRLLAESGQGRAGATKILELRLQGLLKSRGLLRGLSVPQQELLKPIYLQLIPEVISTFRWRKPNPDEIEQIARKLMRQKGLPVRRTRKPDNSLDRALNLLSTDHRQVVKSVYESGPVIGAASTLQNLTPPESRRLNLDVLRHVCDCLEAHGN